MKLLSTENVAIEFNFFIPLSQQEVGKQQELKSVRVVHFAPESNGRSFPYKYS